MEGPPLLISSIKDVGVTADGQVDAGEMVWLTLEALGCTSHAETLLRQSIISVVCPASEISGAVTLVGEQSLLLVMQFTREWHLAHMGGGDLSFTANEVLTSSVGLGSPRVLVHGRLAAPAAPLGNDCLRQRCWSFCASCLKSLRVHTLQSCGFLKQYREAKVHIMDYAGGEARLSQPLTEISAAEKEQKMLQRHVWERGFA